MARNKKTAIDVNIMPKADRLVFESLSEQGKAEFMGFGRGTRRDYDVPKYNSIKEEWHKHKGNAGIVLGLDRPNNMLSGFGGNKDTHCAAVDIVAGRLGFRARSRDDRNKVLEVDPNFKLDAARVYLSQKSDPDSYFGLAAGTVGNTTKTSPRSTVVLKADTLRMVARENIKLVTRTDKKNSQGGDLSNATTKGYGIDLIALNDDSDMQPLVKGANLQQCLRDVLASIQDLRGIFNNFVKYQGEMNNALLNHSHRSPFYGQLCAPDFETLIPTGVEVIVNNLTNVETQLLLNMNKLVGVQQNYLDAPAGAETLKNGKSLFILSKYNNTN
ncbi:hypothetical protein [Hyphomonas sp.]|uniref:hypothetical protein n=1 Tax=Hyphomonas sp. TaxID=87 RepID=UPI000C8A71C8|nr:hypothetical protein [Hyphomonas sp.]MAL45803.1 hypothetical protein [Hyphomonas sp.]|tara:strand:+ start:97 stop:1083 length:987 start_codon:yes stop_codon:yes gene_type:complete